MKYYQLISTDSYYDFEGLLMRAHEQFPSPFMANTKAAIKERFKGRYFNSLFAYKKDDKVYFIFGTNYIDLPFKTNLEQSTNAKMIFEDTKHIKYLEEFKYSKSLYKKNKDVNIYNLDMDNLFKIVLDELPEDLLISIKFRRSNSHQEQNIKLDKAEKIYREKKHKTTMNKTKMDQISVRTSQLNYLFDVDFKLVTKTYEEKDKSKMLSFFNRLKTFTNNNVNGIKINRIYNKYNLQDFQFIDHYTKEELSKFVYVPSTKDFDNRYEELPFLYLEEIFYIPKEDEFNDPTHVNMGIIRHPLVEKRYVYLDPKLFEKHKFTGGMTGSGKTAEILADLKSYIPEVGKVKNGFLYIDPKKMGAIKLLNHILHLDQTEVIKADWSRIHYMDFENGIYVPQLNLLQKVSYRDNNKIIDRTLEIFKDVYDSGSTPLMDKMIRNIIGTLVLGKKESGEVIYLHDKKVIDDKKVESLRNEGKGNEIEIIRDGATILDSIKLISDKNFRNKIIKNIPDGINQEYKDFWKGDIKTSDYNSTTNRLSLFQDPIMKRMYGLNRLDLDFEKFAKEGHIVIVNALDLSDNATTLLIGQMLQLSLEEIMAKGPVPGFKNVVDEGKRAQVSVIPRILAEGREPGCWLSIASQDINLLKKDFAKELISNTSILKIGKHNGDSARIMSGLLQNEISGDMISSLPDNTMIYRGTHPKTGEQIKMLLTNDLPYWYMKDGRAAEHGNNNEENFAIEWTLKKALELQKRDYMHRDEIDKLLLRDYKKIMEAEILLDSIDESQEFIKL